MAIREIRGPPGGFVRGGVVGVAGLVALSVLASLWAVRPFERLPEVVPSSGSDAAGAGVTVALVAVVLLMIATIDREFWWCIIIGTVPTAPAWKNGH